MVSFRDNSRRETDEVRLETPRHAGYRHGMSAAHLIGARLANVYELASDVPGDMGDVLRSLDAKARGHR